MPAVGTGRENTAAQPKRKVKRPKPKVKRVTVAPADRVQERAEVRAKQIKRSVSKSPDRQDTKRSPAQQKRDAKVTAENVKVSRSKVEKTRHRAAIDKKIRAGVADPRVTKSQQVVGAPVLKVLEQTTRPLHGVANTAKQGVKEVKSGKLFHDPNAPVRLAKAAGRGVSNKEKTTFSDVYSEAGWKPKSGLGKAVKAAVSFTSDVGFDPTTFATGGSASVAEKAAAKAAKAAEKKALKQGLTPEQSRKFGDRAHKQAIRTGDQTKGATVKFAGHEVPGVRKATAAASKPVRAAARKVVPQRARDNARAAAADVNPDVAPAGVAKETSRRAVRATRTARAKGDRGLHEAQQQALGIKRSVGEANYAKVIDAIEAEGKGARARRRARKDLSPELQEAATKVRSQFRHANRQRKQAGIRGGERKGYVPHHLTDEALDEMEKTPARGVGRKVIRPSSSKARSEQRSLAELRAEKPGRYSEDLPNLYATRKAEGASAVARAELNRRIADLGKDVKKGQDLELGPNDAVFHIKGSDISEPLKRKEVEQIIESGGKSGRYVVLNKDIVKRAIEGAQPTLEGPGIVRGYDKIQSGFKRIALATPGFHVRNLVGDTQNAYLGQGGHRLPKNMVDAGRVLKAEGRRDKSLRKLTPGKTGAGTVNTKRYGKVSYDEVAAQLSKHGGMRSGYTARELPELSGKKATVRRVRAPRSVKQALLNREDLPRLTTAMDALKRGATWEEAAQKVADYHFDYGHLTRFERNVGRRVAPFYTFTARNVPLQVKTLVTKPGKYANYEKIREEASKLAGMDEESKKARDLTAQLRKAGVKLPKGWEANLSEWEQRNVGVPVRWKGHTFTVSMGLPLADLNEFPGAALGDQIDEYYQKGMSLSGPLPKNVIEYMENHSFFFRDPIERPGSRLVAAPAWVKELPKDLQKKMGVTKTIDKKTNKTVLSYRAKADYVIKSIPGTPAFLNKIATDGHDRVGKGKVGKALSYAGVKATPYDPVGNAVNLAYARIDEIDLKLGDLRQQPNPANGRKIGATNPTPEYKRLSQQQKVAEAITYQGRKQQGYKNLPAVGGPKKYKVRKGSGFDFGGGSGDFDFSGGSSDFDFG